MSFVARVGIGVGVAGAVALGTPPVASVDAAAAAAPQSVQVPYNADFTFTRIRYGGGFRGFNGRGGGQWSHDYPNADRNMQFILEEFTSMRPNTHGSNVLDLEDPEIFRHPILYLSEPGTWTVTDEGARNLRQHLLKGGFIIFDDFDGRGHFESWYDQMSQVLPDHELIEIGPEHPIFDTFFYVQDPYVPHPFAAFKPEYYGYFEDDDPTKRMLALVNWNGDLAEYWEFAAQGFFPVDPTNDSFRLGVNFFVYGLTR